MDAAGRSMHEERLVQLSVPLPCLLQGYSNLALAMQAKPVRLASISVVALLPATTFFQCATEAHLLCRGGEDVVFTFLLFEGVPWRDCGRDDMPRIGPLPFRLDCIWSRLGSHLDHVVAADTSSPRTPWLPHSIYPSIHHTHRF